MRVHTGPFHPDLESRLAARLLEQTASLLARDDGRALPSIAVVVPGKALRHHLVRVLARDHGLALLGLRVLTFHRLALEILRDGHPGARRIAPDLVRTEWVRREVATEEYPDPFRVAARTPGGVNVLLHSLMELEEGVLPVIGRGGHRDRTVREGHLPEGSSPAMPSLERLLEGHRSVFVPDRAGVTLAGFARRAIDHAPDSRFLSHLDAVHYYGAYDLTGVQSALLETVAGTAGEIDVYLPLVSSAPACAFARARAERDVFPLADDVEPAAGSGGPRDGALPRRVLDTLFEDLPPEHPEEAPDLAVVHAPGPEAELEEAAFRVRSWIDEGIPPHRIGIVARTLEPYLIPLPRALRALSIPFTFDDPSVPGPAVLVHRLLVRCLREDLAARPVLDLARSRASRAAELAGEGETETPGEEEPAPSWEVLVRRLGISLGWESWREIERRKPRGWEGLHAWVSAIHRCARSIARASSWKAAHAAFLRGRNTLLDREALDACEDRDTLATLLDGVGRGAWGTPGANARDDPRPVLDPSDYLEVLWRALSAAGAPSEADPRRALDLDREAVRVLDVMTCRGLSFDALYLVGLNEGMFPRAVREDPFLRDADRRRLNGAGAFRLGLSADGYDEERFLFWLLLGSARRRIVLSWQRSDLQGQPLLPSWYLDEVLRRARPGEDVHRVPLAVLERRTAGPGAGADRAASGPGAWTVLEGLAGNRPEPPAQPGSLYGTSSRLRTLEVREELDARGDGRGERDGHVGRPEDYWTGLLDRGVSPTALEQFARCPFQLLAERILRLEPLEEVDALAMPDPPTLGSVLHDLLQHALERLGREGPPEGDALREALAGWIDERMPRAFAAAASERPPLHPLQQDLAGRQLRALALAYLDAEIPRMDEAGAGTALFETTLGAALPVRLERVRGRPPRVHGRVDRLDLREADGEVELEVVDYKFVSTREARAEYRRPDQAAVRGTGLQLPLYVLLAEAWLAETGRSGRCKRASFHCLGSGLEEGLERYALEGDAWSGPLAEPMREALDLFLSEIQRGNFPIVPDTGPYGHCSRCAYPTLCRKNHGATRYRRRADPLVHEMENLKRRKVPK
jgi:ATP-dependent helicase/nuclease subunit B